MAQIDNFDHPGQWSLTVTKINSEQVLSVPTLIDCDLSGNRKNGFGNFPCQNFRKYHRINKDLLLKEDFQVGETKTGNRCWSWKQFKNGECYFKLHSRASKIRWRSNTNVGWLQILISSSELPIDHTYNIYSVSVKDSYRVCGSVHSIT